MSGSDVIAGVELGGSGARRRIVQDQISDVENAKHSVTLDNIQRLAYALNARVADLLDD